MSKNISEKYLTVFVQSFSFHRGLPYDGSGNGGGFVFDCRLINNPGRFEKYKKLTGKDKEVINFFLQDGQIDKFLDSAKKMISLSVEKYIDLEYTHLSISFGCTGGQHRSVYSAEEMTKYILEKFPEVQVKLRHLELEKNNGSL